MSIHVRVSVYVCMYVSITLLRLNNPYYFNLYIYIGLAFVSKYFSNNKLVQLVKHRSISFERQFILKNALAFKELARTQ